MEGVGGAEGGEGVRVQFCCLLFVFVFLCRLNWEGPQKPGKILRLQLFSCTYRKRE